MTPAARKVKSLHPLLLSYTFNEGDSEPGEGIASAHLDAGTTKQALDWYTAPFRKRQLNQLSPLSLEKLDDYRENRWKVVERVHCLINRFKWHWDHISAEDRPSTQSKVILKDSYNTKDNAMISLRRIEKEYRDRVRTPPPIKRTSVETLDDRRLFKRWVAKRSCVSKARCGTECICPDLSQYIIVFQVRFQYILYFEWVLLTLARQMTHLRALITIIHRPKIKMKALSITQAIKIFFSLIISSPSARKIRSLRTSLPKARQQRRLTT